MTDAKKIQLIHRLSHRAWANRDIGLSYSEFEYLNAVREQEETAYPNDDQDGVHGQHLHDIVADLGVTKASASAMIAKLEARGFVERFQCQRDARASHIVLTKEGGALLEQGAAIYVGIAQTIAKELSSLFKDQDDPLV